MSRSLNGNRRATAGLSSNPTILSLSLQRNSVAFVTISPNHQHELQKAGPPAELAPPTRRKLHMGSFAYDIRHGEPTYVKKSPFPRRIL
jgi:hypothetical protein